MSKVFVIFVLSLVFAQIVCENRLYEFARNVKNAQNYALSYAKDRLIAASTMVDVVNNTAPLAGLVRGIREKVLAFNDQNAGLLHPNDIAIIKTQDWFLERYALEYNRDENAAVQGVLNTLKFFKNENLHDLNDTYFPAEFYGSGFMMLSGKGRNNEGIMQIVGRCLNHFAWISDEMFRLAQKFFYYNTLKLAKMDLSGGLIYFNLANYNFTNLEYAYFKTILWFGNTHFPRSKALLLMVDMPLSLDVHIKPIFAFYKNNIKYISFYELDEWVLADQIPVYAGGSNTAFKRIPEGVKSGKCLPHLNMDEAQWEKYVFYNENCIQEGMKEAGITSKDEFLRYKC